MNGTVFIPCHQNSAKDVELAEYQGKNELFNYPRLLEKSKC